ncbi:MAG TPA: hypothetical protein VL947_13970, partial [Cytophagales bacterium]|nr:hypothetical protein [Cytophagales bacterium]
MSNPITATWQDIRLNDIRSTVQSKIGTVPFLMLPVRIETRFMKVKKAITGIDTSVSAMLNDIAALQINLIDLHQKTAIQAQDITEVEKQLQSLTSLASHTLPIPKEKSWFKILAAEVKKETLSLIKNKNLPPTSFQVQTEALIKVIEGLRVSNESSGDISQEFLSQLKGIQQKLATLSEPTKTPFINIKNKKDLYTYVDRTLTETSLRLQELKSTAASVKAIHINQAKRIQEVVNDLKIKSDKIISHLAGIHKDASWQDYIRTLQGDKIPVLQGRLTELISTAAAFSRLPKPEVVMDEKDLYFHGIETLLHLKRFNTSDPGTFKEAKSIQERLTTRSKVLEKVSKAHTAFTPEASKAIKNIFGQVREQLGKSAEQVNKFNPKNNSQTIGKKTISDFISNNARVSVDNIISIPTL